jgi:bacillithiol biosynthesis cysteine-adding enzyme BshC
MTSSMESHCISFREIPDTTKLFSSFLDDFQQVASYYAHPPTDAGIDAAVCEIQLDAAARGVLVEVLREQNRRFGADAATEKNIDRLAAGAVVIVTGQQVGLFSGPAYTIYKAVSALACADKLTRRGTDAVPIFWLATEDHDLAEVNHASWNTRSGLAQYNLAAEDGDAGKRVGEVRLGAAVDSLVALATQTLEGGFADGITRALRESYVAGETYGSAFGKLMARLLAGRGIIFIDQLDTRLHRLMAPVFQRALAEDEPLRNSLLDRSKELERRDFHAQVKVSRETTLLFYTVEGRREPVRSHNGRFSAGKASFSRDELSSLIEKTPEDFSPNALLRPVIQDTLLPTAAYIGGPAEIAYMAQAQVVYKQILGRMPAILPRASFTIVQPPVANLLEKYGLEMRDFFQGRQHLRKKMEVKALPADLANSFDADEKAIRRLLGAYEEALKKLDPSLLGVLQSTESKMLYQFTKLKGKAAEAENFRTGVLDRHERILLDSVYPHRGLQERSLCALSFLAEYGLAFLDDLARASPAPGSAEPSLCAQQHHVLVLK